MEETLPSLPTKNHQGGGHQAQSTEGHRLPKPDYEYRSIVLNVCAVALRVLREVIPLINIRSCESVPISLMMTMFGICPPVTKQLKA
jgi:hypothetical protein